MELQRRRQPVDRRNLLPILRARVDHDHERQAEAFASGRSGHAAGRPVALELLGPLGQTLPPSDR